MPQFRWFYFIALLFVITSFYAIYPTIHDDAMIYFIKLAIIMSIAYKLILGDRDLDIALWGYIFGSWYISFVAFQIGRNAGDRVEGIGSVDSPDANGTAASIAPALVLAFYYFWVSKNKLVKVALAVAGVFIANAIVLVNSRGAFLGVAISMVYFVYHMYFSSFQRKNQKITVIALVICGLIGTAIIVDESFMERMGSITTEHKLRKMLRAVLLVWNFGRLRGRWQKIIQWEWAFQVFSFMPHSILMKMLILVAQEIEPCTPLGLKLYLSLVI